MTFRDFRRILDRRPHLDAEATPEALLAMLDQAPPGLNPEAALVRKARGRLGLTFEAMAEALGVHRTAAMMWANGSRIPRPHRLDSIRRMLAERCMAGPEATGGCNRKG